MERVGVVLNPDGRRFGAAECVTPSKNAKAPW
jgi:hypothetical protein